MAIQKLWILTLCLLSVALVTESILTEHKTYIIDAQAQNSVIIKTWATRGISFFITVTKEYEYLLDTFFDGVAAKEQEERLLIKYNNSTKEISLLFNNISRNDEGLYHVSTSMFQSARDDSMEMENKWNFQLNVLDPGEIKQGYVGEDILITEFFEESIFFPRLYHNYQLIAVLRGSSCDVSTNSPFYGRVRCSRDKENNKIRIEINDVIENDTGLYKLEIEGSTTQRWFLNITDITRANLWNIATTPESSDGISSDQPSNAPLPTTVISNSPVNSASSNGESKLFYLLSITTAAVVTIAFVFTCLIWIQRKNSSSIISEQRILHEDLYLTPIAKERPLPTLPIKEKNTGYSNIAQNKKSCSITWSLDVTQILSKDGYEVVDISNNDDSQRTPEQEEITYESTENFNTSLTDTSGYLTVLAAMETTV